MAITSDADGVDVTFADGAAERFAVVIGADGLHSATRRLVRPGAPDAAEQHLGHAIAVATMPTAMGLTTEETTYVAPGATALMYATATQPRARAMLLFTHDGPLPRDRPEQIAFLRRRFAGQGWRIPEILDALEGADDLYLDSISQVHVAPWNTGLVGLVGDAAGCASPASGQGTTVGLVTGYVTGALLVERGDDVPGALAAAERDLRPFVERNQALGPANLKRMVLPTARKVRSTLIALRIMNALPFTDRLLGVVARKLAASSAHDLPASPGRAQ